MIDKISLETASRGLLDFHMHSTESDGLESPTKLAKTLKKYGVTVAALTDHHVDSGLAEFNFACAKTGIFTIPYGNEIRIELPKDKLKKGDNETPDMIVLGKRPRVSPMKDYQELVREYRKNKFVGESLEKMRKIGFNIPQPNMLEIEDINNNRIFYDFVTKGNNLDTLVKIMQEIGVRDTPEEIKTKPKQFMNKYFYAVGGLARVNGIEGFGIEDAVALVEDMNCKLFIAHPGGEYGFLSDSLLDYLIERGVHGIETRNYFNTPEQNVKFDNLAKKHCLIRSGGSD